MSLDDDRLKQLGRIAATAAELEYYLYALTCELSGPVEGAIERVGNPSFGDLVKLARRRMKESGLGSAKEDQLENFLTIARDAMEDRNRMLHSYWVDDTTQARRARRSDPGVRLEVPADHLADVAEALETAASGMNFMWIEVVLALGRLVNNVDGHPSLTDWTGTSPTVEVRERTPHAPGRWAHAFLSGAGVLGASADAQVWYPDGPEKALDAKQ